MTRASETDRTRISVQVGRCIKRRGGICLQKYYSGDDGNRKGKERRCAMRGEEVIVNRRGRFKYIFHISKAFTVSGK